MKLFFWILRIKNLYAALHVYRSGRSVGLYTKGYQKDKRENKDLTLSSPARLRWSTCPLLFARQDFTPVVILEFLFLFFYLPSFKIVVISVVPTVMTIYLDSLLWFDSFLCLSAWVAITGNANHILLLHIRHKPYALIKLTCTWYFLWKIFPTKNI